MVSTRIQTRAGKIAALEQGTATPSILLIHGNSGTKTLFADQLRALSSTHHVAALDLTGHGESDDAIDPGRDYTVHGYAEVVSEVASALGLKDIVVVGVSLGGFVALDYASWAPDVTGIMIVGSPPFAKSVDSIGAAFQPGPGLELSGKRALSADDIETFIAMHRLGSGVDPSILRAAIERTHGLARTTVIATLLTPDAPDFRHLAQTCPVPVAVAVGDADETVSAEYIASVPYRDLWGGRIHLIPQSGHAPYLSNPAAFNDLVLSFAQSVSSATTD